jgi:hypothetical protein
MTYLYYKNNNIYLYSIKKIFYDMVEYLGVVIYIYQYL